LGRFVIETETDTERERDGEEKVAGNVVGLFPWKTHEKMLQNNFP
jgi:hypothetical protein